MFMNERKRKGTRSQWGFETDTVSGNGLVSTSCFARHSKHHSIKENCDARCWYCTEEIETQERSESIFLVLYIDKVYTHMLY